MKKALVLGVLAFLPILASAQLFNGTRTFIQSIGDLIRLATPVVGALALLLFFWGLAKFIASAGNEGAHEEGRRLMIWGIIALFVMFSIWGIISFIGRDLNISTTTTYPPGSSGSNINIPPAPGVRLTPDTSPGALSLPRCGTVPPGIPCKTNNPFDLTPGAHYVP